MVSNRTVLCVGLALGLLLAPPAAEARFGKRSKPAQSDSSKDDDKVHDAVPVGHEDSGGDAEPPPDSGPSQDDSPSYDVEMSESDLTAAVHLLSLLFSMGNHLEPLGEGGRHASPLSLRMGLLNGMLGQQGQGMDFSLGLDIEHFGLEWRTMGLELPTDDGTSGTDQLTLTQAHASWALIAGESMRVRAEAGVSTAKAPDISFMGPSLGGSLEACLGGPVDVEARVQVTPFPYRQLDASAALALHLGAVMFRAGYRVLLLDDAGLVDGIVHREAFAGPFYGAGLTF